MRKYVVAFLIGSAVVLNPVVFTLLLPQVARLFGSEGNAYAETNQMWMTAVAAGYFLAALAAIFALRPSGGKAKRRTSTGHKSGASTVAHGGATHRGQSSSNGKRHKSESRTRTGKSKRTQLTRSGSGRGAKQARGR